MNTLARIIVSSATAIALTACRSATPAPAATGEPTAIASPDAQAPKTPGAEPPPPDSGNAPRRAWQQVTAPAIKADEGPIMLEAHGFAVSQRDYEHSIVGFLAGRDRTPELEEEFRKQLRDQLMVLRWVRNGSFPATPAQRAQVRSAMRDALWRQVLDSVDHTPPTEEELRRLYEERSGRYRTPERVQVRMIQVPTEEEAGEVLDRLARGESFRSVAASASVHSSRTAFGEIEPFSRGSYIQDFEDKAFALAPGATGYVSTAAGVFIIQKVANLPATVIPFEQVREELRAEVDAERIAERHQLLLDSIRAEVE